MKWLLTEGKSLPDYSGVLTTASSARPCSPGDKRITHSPAAPLPSGSFPPSLAACTSPPEPPGLAALQAPRPSASPPAQTPAARRHAYGRSLASRTAPSPQHPPVGPFSSGRPSSAPPSALSISTRPTSTLLPRRPAAHPSSPPVSTPPSSSSSAKRPPPPAPVARRGTSSQTAAGRTRMTCAQWPSSSRSTAAATTAGLPVAQPCSPVETTRTCLSILWMSSRTTTLCE